jgi:crotonobetainyl-CoA:carnitine CoA-transferase CaiB-like acyl-CoA transferase
MDFRRSGPAESSVLAHEELVMAGEPMLAPYRVLDLSSEWGLLCGRLLADLGADVIKIEKPGGDPLRSRGPFYRDIPDPEKSLFWFFYNANKRGITLDIETADGKAIFRKLVRKADFVIESFQPGYMESIGLGYRVLNEINPRVILTSVTPFGQTGPYSKYKSADIVNLALSGWMNKCGDPDRPPLQMGTPDQSWLHASSQALGGMLVAHYYREMTGEGQYIDATPLPWMTHFSQAPIRWYVTKKFEKRRGQLWDWIGRPPIRYIWECKDGYVCFGIAGGGPHPHSNEQLVEWMDSEGMAPDYLKQIDWRKFNFRAIDDDFRNRIDEPVARFLKNKTKAEIFQEALKRRIMLLPASDPHDMLDNPQFASRGFWVDVEHPELGTTITYPGPLFKSSEVSLEIKRRAPLIGEHNEEIYINEMGFSREDLLLFKQNNII